MNKYGGNIVLNKEKNHNFWHPLTKYIQQILDCYYIAVYRTFYKTNIEKYEEYISSLKDKNSKEFKYTKKGALVGVLQAFDKVKYEDVETLKCIRHGIKIASNMPKPEDMAEAHRINDLHNAGKDSELPYEGMMLTTVVAEAGRMVALEHGPEYYDMVLSGIALGNVALVGIPGEPFMGIGKALKETEGWDMICPSINMVYKDKYCEYDELGTRFCDCSKGFVF